MAGTLFVVATPIGHLDDITLRALEVLRTVSVVAAEDTRHTGRLLRHFGIDASLVSLHEHNERTRSARLVARLAAGESVALVSDAGTPGISDPGAELVRQAREHSIRVEPIPGASAVTAALSVAGLPHSEFAFLGFAPIRSKDRKRWFDRLRECHAQMAVVCFEAPHRLRASLTELEQLVKQPIFAFRELTKLHEEALHGTPAALIAQIGEPRGEFVLVIPKAETVENTQVPIDYAYMETELGVLTKSTTSRRDAARVLAKRLGLSTRQVYEATKDRAKG